MTREEIIKEAAAEHRDTVCCGFDDPIADAREESFVEGAEWADEHPKEGMVSLDKACKVFQEMLVEVCPDLLGYGAIAVGYENDFRKKLEE